MKVFSTILRVIGFVAGTAALVWGCLIAGFSGQPVPLIAAGLLLILIAWVGNGWEEIAAKFGDSEVRVKRVAKTAAAAIKGVDAAAATLPPNERARIDRALRRARANLAQAVTPERHEKLDLRVYGPEDESGRRRVVLKGYDSRFDWTVDGELRLTTDNGQILTIPAADGHYLYPDDWGTQEVPYRALLHLHVGSIYGGGEDEDLITVVIEIDRR